MYKSVLGIDESPLVRFEAMLWAVSLAVVGAMAEITEGTSDGYIPVLVRNGAIDAWAPGEVGFARYKLYACSAWSELGAE